MAELVNGHVGEIKAHILEEGGRLDLRQVRAAEHGTSSRTCSRSIPEFTRLVEERYPGHATSVRSATSSFTVTERSTIKYGRGARPDRRSRPTAAT